MRTFEERPDAIDSTSLDRLVDGDLPENERRELLLRLENDPEGWRRCALAFLEDQAWRKALAPAAADSTLVGSAAVTIPVTARTGMAWLVRGSIAASLLGLTFAAGFAARVFTADDRQIEVAKPEPPAPSPDSVKPEPDEVREVGSLELVDASAGESPPQRFPIRSGRGLDEKWLLSQPSAVPDYLRASWERQGYRLAERRKVVSVELGDGRHVSIPVDEVEVDYVGQRPL